MDRTHHEQTVKHIRWRIDHLRRSFNDALSEIEDQLSTMIVDNTVEEKTDTDWKKTISEMIDQTKVKE